MDIRNFIKRNGFWLVLPLVIVCALLAIELYGLEWIAQRFQQFRYVGF
jgi:hypothetical protein